MFNLLAIKLIDSYQHKKPECFTNVCRFEPSCSEYMKLAIKKYGLFSGINKGSKRIYRCRYPNGGIDYP
jgi:hypothetical protein